MEQNFNFCGPLLYDSDPQNFYTNIQYGGSSKQDNISVNEHELSYIVSVPHYIINRDGMLSIGTVKYFYEVTRFNNKSEKLVYRKNKDKKNSYIKNICTFTGYDGTEKLSKFVTNLSLFVYKDSIETQVNPQAFPGCVYVCERIEWPDKNDKNIKHECTIKIPVNNNKSENIDGIDIAPDIYFIKMLKNNILPMETSCTISVEYTTKPPENIISKPRLNMMETYGIDYSMVYKNINRMVYKTNIARIVMQIEKNKPRTINIMAWRKIAGEEGTIYKSHKPDGYNGIAIFSKTKGLLIYSQGCVYMSSRSGELMDKNLILKISSHKDIISIINSADYVIHGEMMENCFIIFAIIPIGGSSSSIPNWSESVNINGVKSLMKTLTNKYEIKKRRYYDINEDMPDADYITDGIVVIKDTGNPYTQTRVFKIKPPNTNTIDVRLKFGKKNMYYATAVFSSKLSNDIVVKSPLLTSGEIQSAMPIMPNKAGYIDGCIYECSIDPNNVIVPIKIRRDKRNANSIQAVVDTLACFHLPDWIKIIKGDIKTGFYQKKNK